MSKIYMKAVTDKGTPEYIARGWALGVFIGFLIPFGLQLICSIPLSFLLKGSKLGAMVGTLVTNHVSIIVIYPVQCYIGNKLIGGSLTFAHMEEQMKDVIIHQEYKVLLSLGWEIVISFFAGGLLFAVKSRKSESSVSAFHYIEPYFYSFAYFAEFNKVGYDAAAEL